LDAPRFERVDRASVQPQGEWTKRLSLDDFLKISSFHTQRFTPSRRSGDWISRSPAGEVVPRERSEVENVGSRDLRRFVFARDGGTARALRGDRLRLPPSADQACLVFARSGTLVLRHGELSGRYKIIPAMLIPAADAEHFLRVYKAMLHYVAGRPLSSAAEYIEARRAFFEGGERSNPPTEDADLRKALAGASYDKFVVGRHLARYTELVGPDSKVHQVKGVTTELRDVVKPWSWIQTAVMPFRGHCMTDGLVGSLGVHIGPNMRKEILATIRSSSSGTSVARRLPDSPAGGAARRQPFTEKQGQYLAFIYQYAKLHRQAPAEADLQRYFQVSPPSVHQMVLTLERRGFIRRIAGQSRSITLLVPAEELPRLI
jgi:hypothetical protein